MVTIIRSEIDIYKEAYKEMKFRCEIAETFNKRYEEQIKILQEENNAYKILLRKQLGGEEVDMEEKHFNKMNEDYQDWLINGENSIGKEKTADEMVILTPMYKGETYKYHECSNCKKEIYFEEDMFQPFHFEENIKYCPFCGKEIIRYAKPKFIEEISWHWLDEYKAVVEKMYRELKYKIYCKLDKEKIDELEEKSARGIEYFGQDRWSFPYSNGIICDIIHQITRSNVHYTEKLKLEKEFGGVISERKVKNRF